MVQKIVIDTDPGIDDAMAILFACLHPELELVGLTTVFGNVTGDVAARNALVLVDIADQDIDVARGSDVPLVQDAKPYAWEFHGREGFGDLPPREPQGTISNLTAAEFLCETVNRNPGEVVFCAVGPLTNLADALALDPSIAEAVKSVVVMGGSLDAGGNVTPAAEANIWQDPHAANRVFSAPWDVTLVGLDVTHQVICSPADFAGLARAAPTIGGFLDGAAQYYFEAERNRNGMDGCYLHDPTAVIAVIRPSWFRHRRAAVAVVETGKRVGATVWADSAVRHPVSVCVGVEADNVRRCFLETIRSGF
ncbi:MAG: nucleoside hydrolase [Paracoccaceae bacterium]|nr:nucleoside hydrolase [Paracoccaceae bacterium]MDE2911932.1 nucleoside hydrolase [Paracoccaceae bacterium]